VSRIYYDTEFIEDGRTIDLISIGLVAQDGREYYAVSAELDQYALSANPWLVDNVRSSLPSRPCGHGGPCTDGWHLDTDHPDVKSRRRIAADVAAFLLGTDGRPELWADYGAYDHVALCQLWGTMMDLPAGVPMFTHDLQQEIEKKPAGDPGPQQVDGLHNALADARFARELGRWVGLG
jgi:3' exoribonuclease, RNase T-like